MSDKNNIYFIRGLALHQQGRLLEARDQYEKQISRRPNDSEALHLFGVLLAQIGQHAEAVKKINEAIIYNNRNAVFHFNLGNALLEIGKSKEAIKSYDRAINLSPDYLEARYQRANALVTLDQFDVAIKVYAEVVRLAPDHVLAWKKYADALIRMQKTEQALACFDQVVRLMPEDAEAHYNKGVALHELGRLKLALSAYEKAILLKHDSTHALNNYCVLMDKLGMSQALLDKLDKIIENNQEFSQAYVNRGIVLMSLGRPEDALANYERAIAINSGSYEAHFNYGIALNSLYQYESALQSYDKAIHLDPDKYESYYNRGIVLQSLNCFDAAVDSYDKAILLNPACGQAYHNKGAALISIKRYEEALKSFEMALSFAPEYNYLEGTILHAKMSLCDWDNFDKNISNLISKVIANNKSTPSFAALSLVDSPIIHSCAANIWVKDRYPINNSLGDIPKYSSDKKIRIGYFSSDFYQHPVSILLVELFERHDRNKFELVAFSTGKDNDDLLRRRIKNSFDHFLDITHLPDKSAAQLARQWNIDIAVDLNGFTQGSRAGVFAYRAAPIQLSYVGYLGTMGAEYYDYLLADPVLIPEENLSYYSEKIVYLPSYQVNDSKRKISDRVFTRAELGLPERGFVFCCFNNNYKITPSTFDSWMRILQKVDGGVLMLYVTNPTAKRNLLKEVHKRSVDPNRLIFADRLPYEEHLARYRAMDLFLDTLPYNAGATASDALWSGLPVLTQKGQSFASRYAASLLTAIDLPELITNTPDEYEALAINLATHPEKLKVIKQRLQENRLSTPLFNTQLFAQNLELAFTQMFQRYQADLSPEHLFI